MCFLSAVRWRLPAATPSEARLRTSIQQRPAPRMRCTGATARRKARQANKEPRRIAPAGFLLAGPRSLALQIIAGIGVEAVAARNDLAKRIVARSCVVAG